MILDIIIAGIFFIVCVGIVVVAIKHTAKDDKKDLNEDDHNGPVFPCPLCGKGKGTIGRGAYLFCPECGYRTSNHYELGDAVSEWNRASAIRKNEAKIPFSCFECLSKTQYARVTQCEQYKRLEKDPLTTSWINVLVRVNCPMDKIDDLPGRRKY